MLGAMSDFATEREGALLLSLQVVPRASRARLGPVLGDAVRIAVTAPPVDGDANAAVIELLAKSFGVRRAAVEIVQGARGRRKTVRIQGATRAALLALLAGDP
jgi:uncharacterized protein (TIGR00251 family)